MVKHLALKAIEITIASFLAGVFFALTDTTLALIDSRRDRG
jgi:hypothetical protein